MGKNRHSRYHRNMNQKENHTHTKIPRYQACNYKFKGKYTTEIILSQTTKDMLKPFVTNLSDLTITDAQLLALSKGLKFIPTPNKPDRSILINDINKLQRRTRITYLMHKKPDNTQTKFRLPSKWTPKDSGN